MPQSKNARFSITLLLLLLPSIMMMFVLSDFFPGPGLGLILSTPATLVLNFLIAVLTAAIPYRKAWFHIVRAVLVIPLTCWIAISFYPQDSGISIKQQTQEAMQAIRNIDEIDCDELTKRARYEDPIYVVALYKYKDEIPFEDGYQMYRHPNSIHNNYTITKPGQILFNLKGYHKAMWVYMSLFE